MIMKALLIIDMQVEGFRNVAPRFITQSVIIYINEVSDQIRKSGNKVIFIQHDVSKEDAFY